MKKVMNILTGWGKKFGVIPVSRNDQKLSELRLKICGKCDLSEPKKVLEILNGHANYENRLFCTKCKCPCLQKSLVVDESCPIGKW